MQVDGALQGGSTRPRRGRVNLLLATLVIAAMVALAVWVVLLATSQVGAEDAVPKAGVSSAIIHDDAGNMHRNAGSALLHDDAGSVHPE